MPLFCLATCSRCASLVFCNLLLLFLLFLLLLPSLTVAHCCTGNSNGNCTELLPRRLLRCAALWSSSSSVESCLQFSSSCSFCATFLRDCLNFLRLRASCKSKKAKIDSRFFSICSRVSRSRVRAFYMRFVCVFFARRAYARLIFILG